MNSNLVKPEKFDQLHLVCHFKVPLMQCNILSSRNSHGNIEIMVNSYTISDFFSQRCRHINNNNQVMECIICLEKGDKKSFVQKSSLFVRANLLEKTREQAQFKDCSVLDFAERLESPTAEELFERKVNYLDKCYSSFANDNKLDLARKRFAESINLGKALWLKEKNEGHHLLEKRLTIITNFLEQDQRLNDLTKLCA